MERNPLIIVQHKDLLDKKDEFEKYADHYEEILRQAHYTILPHLESETCTITIQYNEYALNIIQTDVSSNNEATQRLLNLLTIPFTLDYGE